MARKTIESRIRSSLTLASSLTHYGGRLTAGLNEHLGGSFPDQRRTFELLAEALLAARRELIERDEEHRQQILEGRGLRRERDRLSARLRRILVRVRGAVSGIWGPEQAEAFLALDDRTSHDPVVLATQGRWVRDRLASAPIPELDLDLFRSRLDSLSAALDQAVQEVLRAHHRQKNTRISRAEATRALDEVYTPARKALLAFGELAGIKTVALWLHEEATKVGRPRKTKAEPPPPPRLRLPSAPAPAAAPARA